MLINRGKEDSQSPLIRKEIINILRELGEIENENRNNNNHNDKLNLAQPKVKIMNRSELDITLDKIIYGKTLTNEDRVNATIMKSLLRDLEDVNTVKSKQSETMQRLKELNHISYENEVAKSPDKKALHVKLPTSVCFTINNMRYRGIDLKDLREQNLLISSEYSDMRDIALGSIIKEIKKEPIKAIICSSTTNCQGEKRMHMVNSILNNDLDLVVLNDVRYTDLDIIYAVMRNKIPLILLCDANIETDLHVVMKDISNQPLIMSQINSIYF